MRHEVGTHHIHTQTQEDQTQGQRVTQGSQGVKTGTIVQVKEVTFSLFSKPFFKPHQQETIVSTKAFGKWRS